MSSSDLPQSYSVQPQQISQFPSTSETNSSQSPRPVYLSSRSGKPPRFTSANTLFVDSTVATTVMHKLIAHTLSLKGYQYAEQDVMVRLNLEVTACK